MPFRKLLMPIESYEAADEHHQYAAYDEGCGADEDCHDTQSTRRRGSLVLVMAIFGLAVVGTAGAFGYRAMFVGPNLPILPPISKASNGPSKIAPASAVLEANNAITTNQADAKTTGSLVSREEQPGTIEPPKPAPRVISTIPMATGRADQSGAADVTLESTRAHMAAARTAFANANSTAAVAPSGSGGGYAVQVTSERSESKAQAVFRALQAQYPNQLSGRQPIIRRADLGAKGTYYRALVGPFASAEEAAGLCSGLKAAGGNCVLQRN
jgi:SPOR domain